MSIEKTSLCPTADRRGRRPLLSFLQKEGGMYLMSEENVERQSSAKYMRNRLPLAFAAVFPIKLLRVLLHVPAENRLSQSLH